MGLDSNVERRAFKSFEDFSAFCTDAWHQSRPLVYTYIFSGEPDERFLAELRSLREREVAVLLPVEDDAGFLRTKRLSGAGQDDLLVNFRGVIPWGLAYPVDFIRDPLGFDQSPAVIAARKFLSAGDSPSYPS